MAKTPAKPKKAAPQLDPRTGKVLSGIQFKQHQDANKQALKQLEAEARDRGLTPVRLQKNPVDRMWAPPKPAPKKTTAKSGKTTITATVATKDTKIKSTTPAAQRKLAKMKADQERKPGAPKKASPRAKRG